MVTVSQGAGQVRGQTRNEVCLAVTHVWSALRGSEYALCASY